MVPINSSLSTITLLSSLITTLVYRDPKYSVTFVTYNRVRLYLNREFVRQKKHTSRFDDFASELGQSSDVPQITKSGTRFRKRTLFPFRCKYRVFIMCRSLSVSFSLGPLAFVTMFADSLFENPLGGEAPGDLGSLEIAG